MAFIGLLALFLILIEYRVFHLAAKDSASGSMDAASSRVFARLQLEVAEIVSIVRILSTSPSLGDSNDISETDRSIDLLEAALYELPQMDSIYVGYDNGSWLQLRRVAELSETERAALQTPAGTETVVSTIRPTPEGDLPLRRIFRDEQSRKIEQFDIWDYGFDPRRRGWYIEALSADRLVISSPYIAYSIGAPVVTVSMPLRGTVRGVIGADLKLDDFSDFVHSERPGEHGMAVIFDSSGTLVAHPQLMKFVEYAMTHPAHPLLPNVRDLDSPLIATILNNWDGRSRFEGIVRDAQGFDYFFRVGTLDVGAGASDNLLLLAAQTDFDRDILRWQLVAVLLAAGASAAFIPGVWFFGGRMTRSLKGITAQASKLQTLTAPDEMQIRSCIREVLELGNTVGLAQRAIWSFAHFIPKEIVRRIVDNSISTELGGTRQEITVLFSDVRNFSTIAEAADPDLLMRQTSRYFATLTDAILAEGGTVDKFIGDGLMVFWNAPNPQPDHAARACRAALACRQAGERINSAFAAEGLPEFFTRFGIHLGEAVVGNLGSDERMEYTALGNTVNLASRLEGLNKDYGTAILVSETVRARVVDSFVFRPIGTVIAKGMTKEIAVYELVAKKG